MRKVILNRQPKIFGCEEEPGKAPKTPILAQLRPKMNIEFEEGGKGRFPPAATIPTGRGNQTPLGPPGRQNPGNSNKPNFGALRPPSSLGSSVPWEFQGLTDGIPNSQFPSGGTSGIFNPLCPRPSQSGAQTWGSSCPVTLGTSGASR